MPAQIFKNNFLKISFSPNFSKSNRRPREFDKKESTSGRWGVLASLLLVFVIFILGRLFELQIIGGSYYKSLSEGNRIRRIPIKAPRGEILDRNGVPIARNVPVYKLAEFSPSGVVEKTEVISREHAIEIQTTNQESSSRLLIDSGREYPFGEVSAHLVGFVNETTEGEVGEEPDCQNVEVEQGLSHKFELGDLVGRMGIEQQYDCLLRGVNGEELIEVDARGRLVRRLGRKEPIVGKNVQLTIDIELQKTAFESLQNAPDEKGLGPRREKGEIVRGGLIAQNPKTGEVLALVSAPSFDPGLFAQKYQEYAQDKNLPFFNRAIGGAFHPGSTFKIVTSVSALQENAISGDFTYKDVGFVEAGGIRFRNWLYTRNGGTEGEINVVRAIARSTDTFFYIVGDKTGIENIAKWAQKFGIGQKTGIDLPNEASGLMPTPSWKQETKGERWFLGNTYNTSIGQGDVSASALQINTMTSAIANSGNWCKPHVKIKNDQECISLELKNETLQLVEDGMNGACSSGGTSGQFLNFKHKVACKTGTAEVGNNKTHAWFTAFAPSESEPQLSVTTVIEEGGEGSVVAAPVVRRVVEKYFETPTN